MDLQSLLAQYRLIQPDQGKTAQDKAKRGYIFERLLSELFRLQGILMTEPFRITGEQIDGAFEYKGLTYLLEAKWRSSKTSTDALYAFQGKTDRRIEGTRGLFISMAGFYTTSVDRLKEGKKPNILLWTGEHIEAVLTGRITIPELLDLSNRFAAERSEFLVSPDVLLASWSESMFKAARQACAAQVDAEISTMVGKKFISKLYVERKVEERLEILVNPERQVYYSLLAELRKLKTGADEVDPMPPESDHKQWQPNILIEQIKSSQSHDWISYPIDNDLLRAVLDTFPQEFDGRMHIVIARAGTGKTNLFCHLAKQYAMEQPTVFLTGRSGITETTSIKELIESKLSRFSSDPLPREHLLGQLLSVIERQKSSLLIFLDAMNEHRDLGLLNTAIAQFLNEIKGRPVVIIGSCRDVYWPYFDTEAWPRLQWSSLSLDFDIFSPTEFEKAIEAYFDFYNLNAHLSDNAKEKLAHPLILRFFCEAYGNPSSADRIELPEISDIRLKVLFDDYLCQKLESIRYTAPRRRRTCHEVEDFVFSLADEMRQTKRSVVYRDDIPRITKQTDLESPESIYVAILGEDIILEEEPERDTGRTNVMFTYDEFMEYVIARCMIRKCQQLNNETILGLIQECQIGLEEFLSFAGVIEYLGIILREEHGIQIGDAVDLGQQGLGESIVRAIAKLGPQFFGEPEFPGVLLTFDESSFPR
jgi:hypothetical protein